MWFQSYIYDRLASKGISHDPRYIAWVEAFKGLFSNPLGGKQAKISLFYAHNLWLDVGWKTGMFPFIILMFFTIMGIIDYNKLLRKNTVSQYYKYLIGTNLCGFFITSMVEPVMEANLFFFCSFCFTLGVIRMLNKENYITSMSGEILENIF